jgi:ABC-2 type transport system ATP-binding protein
MSISVRNISKLYGAQKALDSVSIEIKPGEIVGLLGPNGAGKSTLMKILTCFIPPTSGEASVCGFDVLEQSVDVRRKVGYLPESNPLYLDLYVKEFLEFMGAIQHKSAVGSPQSAVGSLQSAVGSPQSAITAKGSNIEHRTSNIAHRISQIIDLTGLGPEQHKKIGALSKGYRQRVGLAHALLHDPEVLILDEPTSGLDPNQILEIRNLIREISREKTIMLSTHIMQEVEALCDRVIIIHKGKIISDNTTSNMHNLASGEVVVRVEFDKPVEGAKLKNIAGVKGIKMPDTGNRMPDKENPESGIWHLVSAPERDIRPDVFRFAVDNGLTIISMNREEQKLEEVFQELTRN